MEQFFFLGPTVLLLSLETHTCGMLGIFLNFVAMTAKTGKILSSGGLLFSASLHLTILSGHPLAANAAVRWSRMWGWRREMQM